MSAGAIALTAVIAFACGAITAIYAMEYVDARTTPGNKERGT